MNLAVRMNFFKPHPLPGLTILEVPEMDL